MVGGDDALYDPGDRGDTILVRHVYHDLPHFVARKFDAPAFALDDRRAKLVPGRAVGHQNHGFTGVAAQRDLTHDVHVLLADAQFTFFVQPRHLHRVGHGLADQKRRFGFQVVDCRQQAPRCKLRFEQVEVVRGHPQHGGVYAFVAGVDLAGHQVPD